MKPDGKRKLMFLIVCVDHYKALRPSIYVHVYICMCVSHRLSAALEQERVVSENRVREAVEGVASEQKVCLETFMLGFLAF